MSDVLSLLNEVNTLKETKAGLADMLAAIDTEPHVVSQDGGDLKAFLFLRSDFARLGSEARVLIDEARPIIQADLERVSEKLERLSAALDRADAIAQEALEESQGDES